MKGLPPMSSPEPSTFGALLRRFRLAAGLTQEALAERAGLSSRAVSDLERGINRTARLSTLGLLADALHLGMDERTRLLSAGQESGGRTTAQPSGGAAMASAPMRPSHNLPALPTSLIGRTQEVATVTALLRRPAVRLVTLTGSGGVGKTRLALAAATALLDDFAGGIWLVELAPLTDPALVPVAAARAVGLREEASRSPTQALCDHLKATRALLLLDNCEHLIEACADLASVLLGVCPDLHVLATSRECLGVPGEQGYRVPSLSAPGPRQLPRVEVAVGYEAIRLFVERAQERREDFVLNERNVHAVAEICARLDGVPLAIELAAARIRSLGVEEIATRLDESLHLLTGGPRTAPTRQQTLRGALAWSWALLDDVEQALLRRLSVFAGGWTLGAAEAVCAGESLDTWAVLDALDGLVRKSLTREGQGEEGDRRYRLLEPVRQYAAEQLALAGEDGSVRERHLRWAVGMAERAADALTGPEQGAWLVRLEAEHDNLRTALAWSLRGGFAGLGLQLAGALWRFWVMRGHVTEGRRWLEQVLGHSDAAAGPVSLRARAHNGAGNLAWWQGDFATARAELAEAMAIRRSLGDKAGIAGTLNNLGIVAYLQGDFAGAQSMCKEGLALYRELGDRWGTAASLHNLGLVMQEQGDFAQAQALHRESLALRRALGDSQGIAGSLGGLADVAYLQGDFVGAQPVYEESLALLRELGDSQGVVAALVGLGHVSLRLGAYARARDLLEESLALLREIGDTSRLPGMLEGFARLAAAEGQPARAAQLWGALDALRQTAGKPRPPSEQGIYEQDIAALHTALGATAFEEAWAAGRDLPLDGAIALALDGGDTT